MAGVGRVRQHVGDDARKHSSAPMASPTYDKPQPIPSKVDAQVPTSVEVQWVDQSDQFMYDAAVDT